MTVKEIKSKLASGICEFKYTKVNGEERTATGTLNVSVIAEHDATPSGNGSNDSESQVRYYDIKSNGWRSFRVENFVEFLG